MTASTPVENHLIVEHLPAFVRRVLVAGCAPEGLGHALRARGVSECYAATPDAGELAAQRQGFDSVFNMPDSQTPLPFPEGYFDCVLIPRGLDCLDALGVMLPLLTSLIAAWGCVLIEIPNRRFWRGGGAGSDPDDMGERVKPAGLALYGVFRSLDPESQMIHAGRDGTLVLGGVAHRIASDVERLNLITTDFVFMAVAAHYDAISHAGALFDAGHPDWAYEVLSLIPAAYLEDDEVCANVFSEIVLCQLAMDKGATDWETRLKRFAVAQEAFYRAIARWPQLHIAYQCQAEFWHRMGNDGMAARLLRSVTRVAPDDTSLGQLARYAPGRICVEDAVPEWQAPARLPRLLFVTHVRPHYGLDILYDGLCTVLGASNVTEVPWKPSLHGQPPREMEHYPCMFKRPGRPAAINTLFARLERGEFDAILFGDLEFGIERGMARRIIKAAGATPLFIVDEQDDAQDSRREVMEFLDVDSVAGVFKREMLAGADYGPRAYPLPFAYPDLRVPRDVDGPRNTPVFWAGHRQFGLRRLYLERIEATRGIRLDAVFEQQDYVRALLDARIGLNIFGCGFDTVRYWELPAHGCMLLSERLPIRIPHNFVDGESAVFFDDTQDLEEKLEYYLAHPDEVRAIAHAGHEHFKRYHTGSMRARQLLAWMQLRA